LGSKTSITAALPPNCAIELSTPGLHKGCHEMHPNMEIHLIAFHKGVPFTFGSDAHEPAEVEMNFAEAIQFARRFSYRERCRVARRERHPSRF
jgi:histidinol-phosphatase (PHP family)